MNPEVQMKRFILLLCLVLLTFTPLSLTLAEDKKVDPDAELKAASDYFQNLGINKFDCDIKIIFDPAERYKKKDIENWNVAKDTYIFLGHYHYKSGGIFSFEIFGETIAKNDAKIEDMQSTIVVPLLPFPGSIMSGESIKKRYTSTYKGESEFDSHKCHRIRLDAIDYKTEFFKHMEYYIDTESKVIRQVDCAFELGVWAGSGHGEFFYSKKKGKLLPSVGYGDIYLRNPYSKRMPLWGKWSGYKIGTEKDIEVPKEQEPPKDSSSSK